MSEHPSTLTSLAFAAVMAACLSTASADTPTADGVTPAAAENAHRIGVETDVLTLLRGGFGALGSYQSDSMGHLRIAVGANKSVLPSFVYTDGGSAEFYGGTLNGYYHFGKRSRGWFVGAQIMVRRETYFHVDEPGMSAKAVMIDPSPFAGYRWYPLDRGPYVMAFAKLGVPFRVSGDSTVGSHEVEPRIPISPYIGIHLGWELSL